MLKALQFALTTSAGAAARSTSCATSPANILISYAGEVKLTDFGISRAAFQAKSLHTVIRGKYAYMSPEQVDGRGLDGRTDLFSLGIVLYEAVTGRRLFKAKKRDQTLDRVRRAEVPSPRHYRGEISEDLERLLLRSLARRPENRFQSAGEFLDAINQLMVREGHRATNNDVATYLKAVIDAAAAHAKGKPAQKLALDIEPSAVVVLSVEASPPPRSLASPKTSLEKLTHAWASTVYEAEGDLWGAGRLHAGCLGRPTGIPETLARPGRAGLNEPPRPAPLSAGIAPGGALASSRDPAAARGLVRGAVLPGALDDEPVCAPRTRPLTEVGARQVRKQTTLLGRIPIQGNRHINLYELG